MHIFYTKQTLDNLRLETTTATKLNELISLLCPESVGVVLYKTIYFRQNSITKIIFFSAKNMGNIKQRVYVGDCREFC
jgi:hypothetical protein